MTRHTDKLELVETHNIALSIQRLRSGNGGYDDGRWKRALCHAIWMVITNYDDRKRIREALELP
jgi:hypothetical protein